MKKEDVLPIINPAGEVRYVACVVDHEPTGWVWKEDRWHKVESTVDTDASVPEAEKEQRTKEA